MAGDKMADKPAAPAASAPAAGGMSSGMGDDSKLFGALCYIINVIVPLFIMFTDKKNDKFALFHAYQALFYAVVWFVIFVVYTVVTIVVSIATAGIGGFLLSCLSLVIWIAALLGALFGAWKAWSGEKYKFPVIGAMAEKYAK